MWADLSIPLSSGEQVKIARTLEAIDQNSKYFLPADVPIRGHFEGEEFPISEKIPAIVTDILVSKPKDIDGHFQGI